MGGLVPRTESAVLGGLPFTSADYCDFRTHGPHVRIDDLSAPSGRFVTRVSASVANADRCPGRGQVLPPAETAFDSVFAVPTEVGTRSAEAPADATVAQPTPFSRSCMQGTDSVVTTGPTVSAPVSPGSPARRRRRSRLWTVAPLGRTGVQQQQPAMHPLLWTMASGPAGPLDQMPGVLTPRRESHGRGRPRPPPQPLFLPLRLSPWYQFRPTATAQSRWELLSYDFRFCLATRRLHLQS